MTDYRKLIDDLWGYAEMLESAEKGHSESGEKGHFQTIDLGH